MTQKHTQQTSPKTPRQGNRQTRHLQAPKHHLKARAKKTNGSNFEFKNSEHFGTRIVIYTLTHTNFKMFTTLLLLSSILFYPMLEHVAVVNLFFWALK
jgi:hypothetical protein